jgi:hypothetical protein
MIDEPSAAVGRRGVATVVGLASSIALAVVWHWLGFVTRTPERSYEYTQYFSNCVSIGFALAFAAVAFGLGRLTGTARGVAIGMVLPLPLAMMVEIARDRTSHNLMPFEVALYWVPAFAVAFAGAYLGRRSSEGSRRGAPADH